MVSNWKLIREVLCEEKCILYSGTLVLGNSTTTALAGTVFQELIIWSLDNATKSMTITENKTVEQPVLHRLKGHEGVLFSVTLDLKYNLISTTSDDRTTRLWKIEEPVGNESQDVVIKDINVANQDLCPFKWGLVKISLHNILSGGHVSRVFRSAFLTYRDQDQIKYNHVVATVGEDSKICLWDSNSGDILKVLVHDVEGKSPIWSLTSISHNYTNTLITGGADGGVKMTDLSISDVVKSRKGTKTRNYLEFTLPIDSEVDKINTRTTKQSMITNDYPRIVIHLNKSYNVLCLTNSGKVFIISLDAECIHSKWTMLLHDTDLFNYALMEYHNISSQLCTHIQGFIVFATLDGEIKVYALYRNSSENPDGSQVSKFLCSLYANIKGVHSGKIFALKVIELENEYLACSRNDQLTVGKCKIKSKFTLLTCGDNGALKLCKFDIDGSNSGVSPLMCQQFVLPSSQNHGSVKGQFWFSCALLVDGALVVGDRIGNIHLFNFDAHSQAYELVSPSQTFWRIHGRLGVGDLQICKTQKNTIWSTGRDGTVRSFVLKRKYIQCPSRNNDSCDTQKIIQFLEEKSCNKLKFSWPDKLCLGQQGQVVILGFHSSNFIAYNLQENIVYCDISCGGSHRSWDFGFSGTNNDFILTFIKEKKVVHHRARGIGEKICGISLATSSIRHPLHSRELSCVHNFQMVCDKNPNKICENFLATGGEDTTIKIHKIVDIDNKIRRYRVATLNGHISNIKCIKSVSLEQSSQEMNGDNSVILISAGGRAQLKLWHLTGNRAYTDDRRPYHSTISCREIASHMLKGNDKVRNKKSWRNSDLLIEDTETRYMDIDVMLYDNSGKNCCGEYMSHEAKHATNTSENKNRSYTMLIAAACSDGVVRLLCVTPDKRIEKSNLLGENDVPPDDIWYKNPLDISVKAESVMHTHTFLRVKFINNVKDDTDAKCTLNPPTKAIIMLAASTDGKLYRIVYPHTCLVDSREEPRTLEIKEVVRLHQSGINGLWLTNGIKGSNGKNETLVITGGDDGAIAITKLDHDTNLIAASTAMNARVELPIHSAPLTDVYGILPRSSFLKDDERNKDLLTNETLVLYVATCSVDQRVCLWQLIQTKDDKLSCAIDTPKRPKMAYKLELFGITKRFSNVPDIQSMTLWPTSKSTISKYYNDKRVVAQSNNSERDLPNESSSHMLAVVGVGMELYNLEELDVVADITKGICKLKYFE